MDDQRSAKSDGSPEGVAILAAGEDALRRSQQRLNLLAEAGRLLGSAPDYEATLSDVCRLVVPTFADWCVLDLVAEDGSLQRLEVAHRDPARVELARELQRRYPPRPENPRGLIKVLRTGEPEAAFEISDEQLAAAAQDEEHLRLLRMLELRSAMIIPLRARGRTLGALTLIAAESGRRYDDDDLRVALELGARIAVAVDNARLFAEAQEAVRHREEALQKHRRIEEQLRLLVEASGGLSASLEMGDVAGAVLALSRRLIAADAYAVWRYQAATGRWGIVMASGLSDEYRRSTIEVLDHTPRLPRSAVVADDIRRVPLLGDRREALEREGIRSMLIVPLSIRGATSGTLVFYYRTPHSFGEVEVAAATALANLAGSAIGSAELYDEVRANDRRKDEFLAMLGHELRNPLSAISNAAAVIRASGPTHEPVAWGMDVVDRQLKHLVRLIDDLLDVSRITRGKILLRRSRVDAGTVLAGAVAAVRQLVEDRGHRLEVACEPGLELDADPTRLEQIVVNLLANAAKYTEPGGEIRLAARRDHEAQEIVIRVRDTGIGIEAEQLPRMFEMFVQGERSPERSEGGLGIGLTLVRRLAEMHGGTVQAHSDGPGRGCEFIVRLPAAARGAPGC
jgi:signal transduction histidine kinase